MLSYLDIILTPIYFLLILWGLNRWKKKYYKNSPLKKYIIPAFIIKAICCILLALLFDFYYGYSDSGNYYFGASEVWKAAQINPFYGLELVFKSIKEVSPEVHDLAPQMTNPMYAAATVSIYKIAGFMGIFCFGAYLPIALIFTLLSFIGSWKIFTVFVQEFPAYYKKIALTCLFAPSFVFWTTNIMKDPLCIFGLGLCVSALYNLMKGKFNLRVILKMVIGAYILLSLKSYIFYLFCVPAFWSYYINAVLNAKARGKMLIRFVMFLLLVAATVLVIVERNYLLEIFSSQFVNDVTSIQNVQLEVGGSTYSLSNVDDSSIIGIIRTYLLSLNVALFRPYLWEIPNVIAIANAMESFTVLMFTFYLLIRLKFKGFFSDAFKNPILTFSLIFTILLAPLAGLVSFNFGTLVRYKAPVIPFYYTYLILLYYKIKEKKDISEIMKMPGSKIV